MQNPEEGKVVEELNPDQAGEQIIENRQPRIPDSKQPECRDNQNEYARGFRGNMAGEKRYGPTRRGSRKAFPQWRIYEVIRDRECRGIK